MDREQRCRSDVDSAVISLAIEVARLKDRIESCEQAQSSYSDEAELLEEIVGSFKAIDPYGRTDEVDALLWAVFDNDKRLAHSGGWCILDNVLEDLFEKADHDDRRLIQTMSFDEVQGSAERWCKARTAWFRNRRYWIQPCGTWLIIKRNRFLFQARTM